MTILSGRLLGLLLCATAWTAIFGLTLSIGSSASRLAGQEPPTLRLPFKNEGKLSEGVGKYSEEDVVKLLGPPDRVELAPSDEKGEQKGEQKTWYVWEDVAQVEVDFGDKGKAVAIRGTFSPHVKAKRITPENFRKLKVGMTEGEVNQILGGPVLDGTVVLVHKAAPNTEKNLQIRRVVWRVKRSVEASFMNGKLSGFGSTNGMLLGE